MRVKASVRGVCAAALLVCSGQASAASVEKQFKQYMALTPEHFQNSATVKDDSLETVAVITTEPGFQIKRGLLGLVNDDNFFRAFIDKKTGKTSYQLYEYVNYVGDWAFFETVNYEGVAEVQSAPLDILSREVGSCSQMLGCFKREVVAFNVDEAVLRRVAALYDPSGKGIAGWKFRLKAKSGVQRDEGMSPAEAAGILNAVTAYKKEHSLPENPIEAANAHEVAAPTGTQQP
jgi:hypothetical protein